MPKILYLNCIPPAGTKGAKVTSIFEMAYTYAKAFPTVSGFTGDESIAELISKATVVLGKKFGQEIIQASYTEAFVGTTTSQAERDFVQALSGGISVVSI